MSEPNEEPIALASETIPEPERPTHKLGNVEFIRLVEKAERSSCWDYPIAQMNRIELKAVIGCCLEAIQMATKSHEKENQELKNLRESLIKHKPTEF